MIPLPPRGGFVIGIGSDIIDVDRIQKSIERHGRNFLDKLFTEEEQAYCSKMKNPYPHYAARFAVKEAVSKAFTTGISEHFYWTSVSVAKGERGEPIAVLDEKANQLLKAIEGTEVLISLSHTATLAEAVAVIVRNPD